MSRLPGITKRAPRVDLRRPAVVIDSDGHASDVTVLDVSSGGFPSRPAKACASASS